MTATYPFGNLLQKQWWLLRSARAFSYLAGTTGAAAKKVY